jgi:hypothetical protein
MPAKRTNLVEKWTTTDKEFTTGDSARYEATVGDRLLLTSSKNLYTGGFNWEVQIDGTRLGAGTAKNLAYAKEWAEHLAQLQGDELKRFIARYSVHQLSGGLI